MSEAVDRSEEDRWAAALAVADPADTAGLLGTVEFSRLSRRGRIDALVALERHRAWVDAQQHRLLAALASEHATDEPIADELDKQWVREEVACALRVSGQSAAHRISLARELATRLPDTLAALGTAKISGVMARRLAETLVPLDDATVKRVQARVLPRASEETFAQFSGSLRRAVLAADPRGQKDRHEAAHEQRAVRHHAAPDGMGEVSASMRADRAAACYAAIDEAARHPAGPDDHRTADQRRADAMFELLTGSRCAEPSGHGGGPRTEVHVTVSLATLLGLDDRPGDLAGHGPIPAALAREIAGDPSSTWRRLVTDEIGRLIDYGRTRYRPGAALENYVRARDVTCRFPSCNRRAADCEIDHAVAWEDGGETNEANLHALCPRHHHLKHEAGWSVKRLPDGTTVWASPTGHRYAKPPEQLPVDRTVRLIKRQLARNRPEDDAPPF